jgi:hypothetical protein
VKTIIKLNINDTYSHFEDELTSHLGKLLDILEVEKVKTDNSKTNINKK